MSRPKGLTDDEWRLLDRTRRNAWRAANREKFNAQRRDYCERHRLEVRARHQSWRDKNKERYNASAREHNKTEKRRAYMRKYRRMKYETDPVEQAKVKQRQKDYRKKNPMKCKAWQIKRLQKLDAQLPSDADLILIGKFYEMAKRISKCIGIKHHVDHIFPISKGGIHHQKNLQAMPARLNQKKNANIISFPKYAA